MSASLSCDLCSSSLLASVSDDCTVAVRMLSDHNGNSLWREHRDFVRGASWDCSDESLLSCAWDGQLLKHSIGGWGISCCHGVIDSGGGLVKMVNIIKWIVFVHVVWI